MESLFFRRKILRKGRGRAKPQSVPRLCGFIESAFLVQSGCRHNFFVDFAYDFSDVAVAVQVCIGYSADGRARHRTFSLKGIRPDARNEGIDAVVRALAAVLTYPITKVRKVTKRTIICCRLWPKADRSHEKEVPGFLLPLSYTC
jgi:hypothetical protein